MGGRGRGGGRGEKKGEKERNIALVSIFYKALSTPCRIHLQLQIAMNFSLSSRHHLPVDRLQSNTSSSFIIFMCWNVGIPTFPAVPFKIDTSIYIFVK